MKLFHAFPRPKKQNGPPSSESDLASEQEHKAEAILRSIFKFGLLCTPERLNIHADAKSSNRLKAAYLKRGEPEYRHTQSRLCLTLSTEHEIYEKKIIAPNIVSSSAPDQKNSKLSHADLFGSCAISFDPRVSRRLGFVPTIYYAPSDMFGERYTIESAAPGFNIQMIQRLKEIREILILLAHIEALAGRRGQPFPTQDIIFDLKLDLPFQGECMSALASLSKLEKKKILDVFNTDREVSLNLVSHVDMMLSLFQQTDSKESDSMFAFYEQREWRLVHHMRKGMMWYSLGYHPEFRNPLAKIRVDNIRDLRSTINAMGEKQRTEEYFSSCWMLEKVDGKPISNYISSVVVPSKMATTAARIVNESGLNTPVLVAENFGYEP